MENQKKKDLEDKIKLLEEKLSKLANQLETRKELIEQYEQDYFNKIEKTRIEDEESQKLMEEVFKRAKESRTSNYGTLPKGFDNPDSPLPQTRKSNGNTLPNLRKLPKGIYQTSTRYRDGKDADLKIKKHKISGLTKLLVKIGVAKVKVEEPKPQKLQKGFEDKPTRGTLPK